MNSKLEALISAYQIKPKKPTKKKSKAAHKVMVKDQSQRIEYQKIEKINHNYRKSSRRDNQSVQPKRSESTLSLSRYLNTSLEEDIERLESLTNKHAHMRSDWLSIKERMIELNINKNLRPIAEIDESGVDASYNMKQLGKAPANLKINSDSLFDLKIKEKMKSMDNLLLIR